MTKDEENELAFRLGRIAERLTVIKDDVLPKLKWNEHGFFEYRAEIGILLDDCLKDTDILTPIFPKDAVKVDIMNPCTPTDAFISTCIKFEQKNDDSFITFNSLYQCYTNYIGDLSKPLSPEKFKEALPSEIRRCYCQKRISKDSDPLWGFVHCSFTEIGSTIVCKETNK